MISVHLVFLVFCVAGAISALPDGLKSCQQSLSGYEGCLKVQINNALRLFKSGNKKLKIIPLDPLVFQKFQLEQTTGAVSINLKVDNLKLYGFSSAQVTSVKNDWKKMNLQLNIPHIHNQGVYTISGTIVALPVTGSGNVTMDWDDVTYTLDMNFMQVTNNGKKYFQVDKITLTMLPKKVTFNFENLFNGNKELSDSTNKYLNDNWQLVLSELQSTLSRTLEIGYQEYINTILSKIPAQDIDIK